MKKLPIGIQNFGDIIEGGRVYIDKTRHIHDLAVDAAPYFLSRPRRFGKSLLCSTFEALFKNKRELFKGLWIDQADWEWKEHPVIHVSMTSVDKGSPELFDESLRELLLWVAQEYGVNLVGKKTAQSMFQFLVKTLAQREKVVIIIDEYDQPVLKHINDPEMADKMRGVLQSFYEPLKDLLACVRFLFITGITKFSKTSIFSALNNLVDLSMDARAATLCGYTRKEIEEGFQEHLTKRAAQENNLSARDFMHAMTAKYDGYRFHHVQDEKLYAPFSVLNALQTGELRDYWFKTGTPTFLVKTLEQRHYRGDILEQAEVHENSLDVCEPDAMDLAVLLFQTGYLTIKDYNPHTYSYTLVTPNTEVKNALSAHLFSYVTKQNAAIASTAAYKFHQALEKHDLDTFTDF